MVTHRLVDAPEDFKRHVIDTLAGRPKERPVCDAEYSTAAKHDRANLDRLMEAAAEAIELLRGYEDVIDGEHGPRPNDAMRAVQWLQYGMGSRSAP